MYTMLTRHGREMMTERKPAHDEDVDLHYLSLNILNGLNGDGRNGASWGVNTCSVCGKSPKTWESLWFRVRRARLRFLPHFVGI